MAELIRRFVVEVSEEENLNRYNSPKFANNVLQEYSTNEGDTAVVLEYQSYECVFVTFKDENTPTDFRLKCQLGDLRRGRVKNPYRRQCQGIGYTGWGIYLTAKNGDNTKVWRTWSNMIRRCYEVNNKAYKNYGAAGVTVCDEWHNFQTFACWFYQNWIEEYELDKDLLISGNKVYCTVSCCFLPKRVNKFVGTNKDVGVWFDNNRSRYVAQINNNGNKIIGRFKDRDGALIAFINKKCEIAKLIAEEHKDNIPTKAYEMLINYKERYEKLN